MEFRNTLNFILSSSTIFLMLKFTPVFYYCFVVFSTILVGIQVAEWCMILSRKYILWRAVSPLNKEVLITGCGSEFGLALARKLDKLGYTVFAACLHPNREDAKKLQEDCSEKVKVLHLDVTDERSIQLAKESVEKNLGQNVLWAVVNNAGIAHTSEIDWTSIEEIQKVYDVNTTGTLRVIKCFLPLLKKSKGRIVNVTSIAGRLCIPGAIGYCMSKSAGIALTTGLRIELSKWGVKVINIEPFIYASKMNDMQALHANAERMWKTAGEEIKEEYGEEYIECFKRVFDNFEYMKSPNSNEVVECFEDAVTAKEPLSNYSPGTFLFMFAIRICPRYVYEYILKTILYKDAKPLAFTSKGKKIR